MSNEKEPNIAELLEEKARLDWLYGKFSVSLCAHHEWSGFPRGDVLYKGEHYRGNTQREAIDAAMQGAAK